MEKLNESEVKKRGVCIQGDVVFFQKGDGLPEGTPKKTGVVAEGEVTGHAHRVNPKHVAVIVSPMPAVLWLKSLGVDTKPIEVEHEEHETLKLPNENHLSWGQQEYDWTEGLRRVAD